MNIKGACLLCVLFLCLGTISLVGQNQYSNESTDYGLCPVYYKDKLIGKYRNFVINEDGTLYASTKSFYEISTNASENEIDHCIYISKNGTKISIKSADSISYSGPFNSGLARIKLKNSLWGYIGTTGEWSILPKFTFADDFKNGYACVKTSSGKWGVINTLGVWVISPDLEGTEMHNYGFGLFSIRPLLNSSQPVHYYNANTNERIEWAKNIEDIVIWRSTIQEIDGKVVLPILLGIRESHQSLAYYDLNRTTKYSLNIYPGLQLRSGSIFRDNKLLLFDNKPDEFPIPNNSLRLRFLDIQKGILSEYFELNGITRLDIMDDSFLYFGGDIKDESYFTNESRVSIYKSLYNNKGEQLSDHMFTDVYTISGDFAGIKIGGAINIYNIKKNDFVFDFNKKQLLQAGSNKWYVSDINEAYLYSVEDNKILYKMPKDDLIWTNGVFSIAVDKILNSRPEIPFTIRSQSNNEEQIIAYINDNNIRLRSGPSIQDNILDELSKGTRMNIIEINNKVENIQGRIGLWMKVQVLNWNTKKEKYEIKKEGWMFSPYIDILGGYQY